MTRARDTLDDLLPVALLLLSALACDPVDICIPWAYPCGAQAIESLKSCLGVK